MSAQHRSVKTDERHYFVMRDLFDVLFSFLG